MRSESTSRVALALLVCCVSWLAVPEWIHGTGSALPASATIPVTRTAESSQVTESPEATLGVAPSAKTTPAMPATGAALPAERGLGRVGRPPDGDVGVAAINSFTISDGEIDFGFVDPGQVHQPIGGETQQMTLRTSEFAGRWTLASVDIMGDWGGYPASDFLTTTVIQTWPGSGVVDPGTSGITLFWSAQFQCRFELDLTSDAAWELAAEEPLTAEVLYTIVQ